MTKEYAKCVVCKKKVLKCQSNEEDENKWVHTGCLFDHVKVITCMICDTEFDKMITPGHLKTHDVRMQDYREKYGPVVSKNYATVLKRRSTLGRTSRTAQQEVTINDLPQAEQDRIVSLADALLEARTKIEELEAAPDQLAIIEAVNSQEPEDFLIQELGDKVGRLETEIASLRESLQASRTAHDIQTERNNELDNDYATLKDSYDNNLRIVNGLSAEVDNFSSTPNSNPNGVVFSMEMLEKLGAVGLRELVKARFGSYSSKKADNLDRLRELINPTTS